jgi:class 3 adenylate cyclase/tetratricopeptide (TPR) repeat protein
MRYSPAGEWPRLNDTRQLLEVESPQPIAPLDASERRYVAIMFSDLSGSTLLAEQMEAEDYVTLLEPIRRAYEEIVPRYGGTVIQISGDGLVAVFGFPETAESAGRMATLAAIELHQEVRGIARGGLDRGRLSLHTGIHSGLVLVKQGDVVRGRLELLGRSTNIASRLASAAQTDEIIVSERTLRRDQGLFHTSAPMTLTLRGKERPITAFRILDRAAADTRYSAREQGSLKPFVGRIRELDRLSALAVQVQAGSSILVSIAGPPGVGKTRLVTEVLSRSSASFQIFRGECDEHPGSEPLRPFLQILRSVLRTKADEAEAGGTNEPTPDGWLGGDLGDRTRALAALLRPQATAAGSAAPPDAAAVHLAFRTLFSSLAAERPVALFIDDWHWADDASRRVMAFLRGVPGLLGLMTIRSHGEGDSGAPFDAFHRISLGPLTKSEARIAVRQALDGAHPFIVREICAAAGGNPLFIEEVCHSVKFGERDLNSHEDMTWLRILIASRFGRLPEAEAAFVRAAAVIGTVIPVRLLEAATGTRVDGDLVRTLGDKDFVFPGDRPGTLRFKHGLTREVVYDTIGKSERQALHLRIANELRDNMGDMAEDELFESLAYHFGAGGDCAEAAVYAERAGDKAYAAAALDRAQHQYRSALSGIEAQEPCDERTRRWLRVARKYALAGVWDPSRDQIPTLKQAIALASEIGDGTALALAEFWLGYVHYGLGDQQQAIAHSERALEASQPLSNQAIKAQAKALLGEASAVRDYDRALPLLEEASAQVRDLVGQGHDYLVAGHAYTLSCKAFVVADMGRFAEARADFEEAWRLVRGSGHPVEASVLGQYAVACIWQGAFAEARRIAEEARRVSERVRSLYLYARSATNAAYACWASRGRKEPLGKLLEATDWLNNSERDLGISLNYGWLAKMMAHAGRASEARHWAARALDRTRRGDRLGAANAYRALAMVSDAGTSRRSAEYYLEKAMNAARQRGSRHDIAKTQLCAAEIDLRRGRRERAHALIEEAAAAFAEMDMSWHLKRATQLVRKTKSREEIATVPNRA